MSTKSKYTKTIPSSNIVNDGAVKSNGKTVLDMHDDPRLKDIADQIEAEKKTHGWKIPQNEKQICERISQLITEKYGPYDKKSSELQTQLSEIDQNIKDKAESIKYLKDEIKKTKDDKTLTKEEKEHDIQRMEKDIKEYETDKDDFSKQRKLKETELKNYTKEHNGKPLKDVKYGETVCLQQAAIASYVMEKVGLHNDLCVGVGHGTDSRIGHAFVQSTSGNKNIIDPTVTKATGTCYLKNKNGKSVADGEVVIVDIPGQENHGIAYGGGAKGFWDMNFTKKSIFEHAKENREKEFEKFILENPRYEIHSAAPYKSHTDYPTSEKAIDLIRGKIDDYVREIKSPEIIKHHNLNTPEIPDLQKPKTTSQVMDIPKDIIEQVQRELNNHKNLDLRDDNLLAVNKPDRLQDVAMKFEKAMKGEVDTGINDKSQSAQRPVEVAAATTGKSSSRQV